eukprot:TRINITY_DN1852_c0_g1_i10.p1 TRINITY_DN1852_c0_g1~~TRINITY_DN1852_c0_g1_i10.p1  ORF type:complete len:285 (-),score=87.97 TRINITY_DN1852_c0_g1_i10:387-1148(-)
METEGTNENVHCKESLKIEVVVKNEELDNNTETSVKESDIHADKKSARAVHEKSAKSAKVSVDLFGEEEEETSSDAIKANNNNHINENLDSNKSDIFNKLEEKISLLSKNMQEGMDQINYVQSLKKEDKKTPEKSSSKPKNDQHKNGKKRSRSPEPVEGQKPAKKIAPAEMKKYKLQLAEDFIQVLIPFKECGTITSKPVFKILARHLTHKVLDKGEFMSRDQIGAITKKFFQKNPGIHSEDAAMRAVKKFQL